ncbi:MAG: helix-turn-helix domain-containing protein [Chloroflexi bacterium]|nr:helix-turn-helix domain-containing protein [Chloroflexota bacterium]
MEELLTTRQVQELLHVDRTTIYRLVASGQLPAIRVGKQWRFTRAAIESWLQHNAAPVAASAPTDNDDALPFSAHVAQAGMQQLQDVLADLLGVMLVMTDMKGHPVTEPSNVCGYYRALMRDDGLGRLCDATWPQLAAALPLKPQFVRSQLGPLCARAFIRVDNRLEGMLVTGCVAPDTWPPTDEILSSAASKAGLEPKQIASSLDAVHHLSSAERERVLGAIQPIADIISQMIAERQALVRRLREIGSLASDGPRRL